MPTPRLRPFTRACASGPFARINEYAIAAGTDPLDYTPIGTIIGGHP
jgi:hypothetical protein